MAFSGSGALGGAGTGAGIGYQLGGPWGAAAGGILGGLGGGLFGDEGGSDTMKVENRPWNSQTRTGMIGAADEANRLAQQPMTMFPGQTYAGFDPRQLQGLEGMEGYLQDQAPGMIDSTQSAWQGALNAPDVANNPYVNAMLGQQSDLLNRNFTENLMPAISGGAMGAGQTGGSRQGIAEGIAARGTQEALARSAASTQMDAYGQGLTAQNNAFGLAPSMTNLGLFPGQQQFGLGGIYQGMDQNAIDEEQARHNFAQEEPWNRVNRATDIYSGTGGTGGSSTTTMPGVPLGDQLLGSAATLGSAWLSGGAPNPFTGGGGAVQNPASYGGYGSYVPPFNQNVIDQYGY